MTSRLGSDVINSLAVLIRQLGRLRDSRLSVPQKRKAIGRTLSSSFSLPWLWAIPDAISHALDASHLATGSNIIQHSLVPTVARHGIHQRQLYRLKPIIATGAVYYAEYHGQRIKLSDRNTYGLPNSRSHRFYLACDPALADAQQYLIHLLGLLRHAEMLDGTRIPLSAWLKASQATEGLGSGSHD